MNLLKLFILQLQVTNNSLLLIKTKISSYGTHGFFLNFTDLMFTKKVIIYQIKLSFQNFGWSS